MKITLPGQQVHIDTPQGVDPVWYEKLQQLATLCNRYDALFSTINPAALTNGQVLIWNSTQQKFVPGAN